VTIHGSSRRAILIQWSETDQVFIASLPEWGSSARTHGSTYEEALANAHEVLADLIDGYTMVGRPLPELKALQAA
jgi:predicted RNase H-like HicB family nuclease